MNCADFDTWAQANETFWTYKVFGDPYRLDGNDNNIPGRSKAGSRGRVGVHPFLSSDAGPFGDP